MLECYHTKGNRHINGEFEVYRVIMGEIAFMQTSPDLRDSSVILAKSGDLFNVIPYYFHRAINIAENEPLVTSDIRPLNTETSYSPVEEKGFPWNVVRDEEKNLFIQKANKKYVALSTDLAEVSEAEIHSEIRIDNTLISTIIEAAKKNELMLGEAYQDTGYIVTNVRRVADVKNYFLNPAEAGKVMDLLYITLDGRLEEVNIANGLTIVMPGAVPI